LPDQLSLLGSELAPQGPDPGYSRAARGKVAIFALVALDGTNSSA